MHPDLVISRESIQEAKNSTSRGTIYQGVNAGQRVGVLREGFVKICEVHAHPQLPVDLLDQYYVRQPLWVLNLPDVANTQQLMRFFPDDLTPIIIELSPSLADRSDLWVHGEVMTQEIGVNARHV